MIAEFESRILALIDNMVDHASDDELFAGGYLRGHLTLAVAELEGEGEHSADAVHSRVSQSRRKPSALANCRRRTKFWCRGCGITCINRRKIRPEPCCSPGQASAVPGKLPALMVLFHRFSLQQFSHPQPIRIQRRPVSLSSGSGSVLICAASSSALNGAVQSPRDPSAPSINRLRQTGALSAISGCSWRLAYCVNVAA